MTPQLAITDRASQPVRVDPVETLLAMLDGVRKYGRGWRANCPIEHTSLGTLSIARGDDDRVLMNCFVGCAPADILAALGMSVADLFPQRDHANLAPADRARIREFAGIAQWKAALGVLAVESTVVEAAAAMIARGDPRWGDDIERVHVATQRIHAARAVLQ